MTRPTALWIFNHHAAAGDQGTGTRHLDLGSQLAAKGVAVTIFAAGFNHFTGREERLRPWQLTRSETIGGVEFVWLRTFPYRGNDLRRILNMISYFAMAMVAQIGRPRPTHVIGSTVHPLAALAGWFAARLHGGTFFFEIRDLWPQTLIDIGALRDGSVAARLLRSLERFLVHRSRSLITVLPALDLYLEEQSLRPRALDYIPNGVTLHRPSAYAQPEAEVLRQIIRYRSEGRFVAVYTGAHATHNRLEVVLEAAELLSAEGQEHIRIVLVGDGPEKAGLVKLCRERGLPNVDFAPPVPKAQVPGLLAASDACILHMTRTPVYRYGISFNKLFDYLASRRPIVFACATTYDPVALARCGLSIPPDDPRAMGDALMTLAATPPAERDAMGARAYEYVGEHHDVDTLASQLLEALSR